MPAKTASIAEPKGRHSDAAQKGDGEGDDGEAATPARRRRVPGWLMAVVGAAVAAGFGIGVEKMMFGPPLVMLTLGGMTLVLCGLALWRMIDPLTRPELVLAREALGRGRARELEREKQAVLKAIKEIELDHQMRKIADVDYRELIERYRGRALRLLSEIEAGDNFRELIERELKDRLSVDASADPAAAPSPTDSASARAVNRSCAACGTTNDDDAQFCKKCGVKIAA